MKYNTAKTYLQWLRSLNEWYQANAGKEGTKPACQFSPVTEPPLLAYTDIFRARCHTAAIKGCLHALNSIHGGRSTRSPRDHHIKVKEYSLQASNKLKPRSKSATRQGNAFLVSDLKALIKAHGTTQLVRKLETCTYSDGF